MYSGSRDVTCFKLWEMTDSISEAAFPMTLSDLEGHTSIAEGRVIKEIAASG